MFYYELFKSVEEEKMDTLQINDMMVEEKIRSGGKGMKRTGKFGGNNGVEGEDDDDDDDDK